MKNVAPQTQEIVFVGREDPDVREVLADPLDQEEIARLGEWARHPELADPNMASLPEQKFNEKVDHLIWKAMIEGTKAQRAWEEKQRSAKRSGQPTLALWGCV